jgi:predicted nucleic acid-binding protein
MDKTAVTVNYFDASALVKLYVTEEGSDKLREYVNLHPGYVTTPFCFYETLSVLKAKLYREPKITENQYRKAAFELIAWFSYKERYDIKDLNFTDPHILGAVQKIVESYSLDYSDAFQILSVKEGVYSCLVNESRPILVTADKKLTIAAREEGIRVWNLIEEEEPEP